MFCHQPRRFMGNSDGEILEYFCSRCNDFYIPTDGEKQYLKDRLEEPADDSAGVVLLSIQLDRRY